jgi:hypothetical protein
MAASWTAVRRDPLGLLEILEQWDIRGRHAVEGLEIIGYHVRISRCIGPGGDVRIAIYTGSYGDYVGLGLVKIRDWSRDLVHAVGSGASRLNDEQQRLRPRSGSP